MLNIPFTLIPVVTGAILIIIWANSATPPIPKWYLYLFGGGTVLFTIVSFLAFHQIRLERDRVLALTNNEYANKLIVDSKAPSVLAITDTLQRLTEIESNTTNDILNKKRHVHINMLSKIQNELQHELSIQPNYKCPVMGDIQQRNLIIKEIEKLNLPKDEYNEDYIRLFLALAWILDEKKYNKGLASELEFNKEYEELERQLGLQTAKLSNDKSGAAISAFRNTSLGINSVILFLSYFPNNYIKKIPGIDKPAIQTKHERDSILKFLLANVQKTVESELREK